MINDAAAGEPRRYSLVSPFIALVALAGLAMMVVTVAVSGPVDPGTLVGFCLLAALAEAARVSVGDDSVAVSLSLAVILAAVVVTNPAGAALVAICAAVPYRVLRRDRTPWRKTVFNTGLYALGAGAAGLTYHVLGGALGRHPITARDAIACLGAIAANLAVNWPLLMTVLHLVSRRGFREIWRDDLRWVPVSITISAFLGFTFGVAFVRFGWMGAVVYATPLLAVRETMRQYTRRVARELAEVRRAHAEADDANRRLTAVNRDLDATNEGLLKTLAAVIDARDVYLYGHSVQASKYAGAVARKLGLSPEEVRTTELGALLHDIGKIGISESILNKPASLTDDEYREVKTHCDIGYELLSNLPSFEAVADIVRSHHEHYDGSGYPRGLKGDQIRVGARIVSVVEAVEAMISDRPYRKGMNADEVLQELAACAGTQWDPDVAEAFSGILSLDRKHLVMRNSALEVALSRTPLSVLTNASERESQPGQSDPSIANMSATFSTAAQPIFILDADMCIVSVNPTAERTTGFSAAALEGTDWSDLFVTDDVRRGIPTTAFGGTRTGSLRRKDGGTVAVEVTGTPLQTTSAAYWLVLTHDVSHHVRRQSELRHQAHTDPLTGLANRADLEDRTRRAMRRQDEPLTMAIIDLDGLKVINDSFGHGAGDRALRALGSILSSSLRADDAGARIGGDEFAIVMPGSGAPSAQRVLARLAAGAAETRSTLPFPLEFSFGIAQWDGAESYEDLLRRADQAMYIDKRARAAERVVQLPLTAEA